MKKKLLFAVLLTMALLTLALMLCGCADKTQYSVTFLSDGQIVDIQYYTVKNPTITEPAVPQKEHYENGAWSAYTLDGGNKTVHASYTPIEYTVTFVANGSTVDTQTYTIENKTVTAPAVPAPKEHYEAGVWEAYTVDGGNKTVNAIYAPTEYTVTFVADGKTVGTVTYTVETESITAPAVPVKDHYENGAWNVYTLDGGNKTVTASYTPITYTLTFVANGVTVDTRTYTVETQSITEPACPKNSHGADGFWGNYLLNGGNKTINAIYDDTEYQVYFKADGVLVNVENYHVGDTEIAEPAVPNKPHYTGKWETYTLDGGNKTVNAVYTPIEYTVTFVANGQTVATETYTVEDTAITVPNVPAPKEHYENGTWEAYTLDGGNKTVNAIYAPTVYTVTFKADGVTVDTKTYTVENKTVAAPSVPEKAHYTGVWNTYTLDFANITVDAVYTPIIYTVTFKADGVTVDTQSYTVENKTIAVPNVPAKEHYTAVWSDYVLDFKNITVPALYTPISYTVTFKADGVTVDTKTYTVENKTVAAPTVPEKAHYTGVWNTYTLDFTNITVDAVYTPITYTVTFVANGKTVSTQTYTVENTSITVPAVPKNSYGADGVWGSYLLNGGDKTVNAIYDETEYKVSFMVNGQLVAQNSYHIGDTEIAEPAVPNKPHYTGKWETYTLDGGIKTVNAVYTPIEYTVTFVAHGETVDTQTYTVESKNVTNPAVPAPKEHYEVGTWEAYTLDGGNKTVNAIYAPTVYTVTFKADGVTVDTKTYTIENKTVSAPTVPEKAHYTGVWNTYTLDFANITVDAVYTPIIYTVTFVDGDITVDTQTYTVESTSITEPAIPKSVYGYYREGEATWEAYSLNGGNKTVHTTNPLKTQAKYTLGSVSGYNKIINGTVEILSEYGGYPITVIGEEAFWGCTELTSIAIPNSVTEIAQEAFRRCENLTSVTISDNLQKIGGKAFSSCSLTSITIPATLTSIGQSAFHSCDDLSAVYISDIVAWLKISLVNEDSSPLAYGRKLYLNGTLVTDLVIPSDITEIGYYALSGCESLTNVIIPNSVTHIGERSFSYCTGLTSVTIPNSVTSIDWDAFHGCTGLTSVTIGNGVTSIGGYAFEHCTSLTSVTIPNSVTSIGTSAFSYCTGLTSVTIGNGVTSIGDNAFGNCTGLTSVTIPNSVTNIGAHTFYGCTSLTSVTIGNGVTSIGIFAFSNCTGLTSVTIPNSVTSIGEFAFSGCTSLTSVTFKNSSGWKAGDTTIPASDLSKESSAAYYLQSAYAHLTWTRTE